jgi:hypothetical protein
MANDVELPDPPHDRPHLAGVKAAHWPDRSGA